MSEIKNSYIPRFSRRTWWVAINLEMSFQATGCVHVDQVRLAHDMSQWLGLVNMVMNFRVPLQVANFDLVARFSRMIKPHSALLLWVF